MRNILIAITLLCLPCLLSAQEKSLNKSVSELFERYYNEDRIDSIFALFSPEMQIALPFEKTTEFITGLKSQAGNIRSRKFMRYQNGTYASYKTTFEKAVFALNISADQHSKINGFFLKQFADDTLPKPSRNSVKLSLPFEGEWTVTWGGDTKRQNYHVESEAQKNAFDIVVTDSAGRTYRGSGNANEDYYAFGRTLVAPCNGEVVLAVDGIKDNKPGELNPDYVPGNTVIIKAAENEYLFFAHFKQHSVKVLEGQKIKKGQVLGLCGNSGNSSEPHLHFHIQNTENMSVATGVKCYFNEIFVNGILQKEYSPVQKEKISNF